MNEWAVIHASKHPCHQRALRYKGNLKSTHPHYLIYEKGNHLFLNIVDMTKPLKHKFMMPIIIAVYAFIDKNIKKRNILIHCNLGKSRSPTLALLYLARKRIISFKSYEEAKEEFNNIFPRFRPQKGIDTYLKKFWEILTLEKGETALSKLFCKYNNHMWLLVKINLMKDVLENPAKFFSKISDNKVIEILCENVKIEIVCTTIQYIELFNAYLQAFYEKDPRFQKVILNYKVKDIEEFFDKILNSDLMHILEVTGYPSIKKVVDKKLRKDVLNYCSWVKDEISRMSSFYKKYKDTYNSYKHGLRLFPIDIMDKESNMSPAIINIFDKKNIACLKYEYFESSDIEECIEIANSISLILNNSLKAFEKWAIDKETNFEVAFFTVNKK